MKRFLLIVFFFQLQTYLQAQSIKVGVIHVRKIKQAALSVSPEFPGGDPAMQAFIRNHTDYPEAARLLGLKGFVDLSFKIGTDGRISDIQVTKGLGSGCDESAAKMVKEMPAWVPARLNQEPVAVQYSLHVPFPAR